MSNPFRLKTVLRTTDLRHAEAVSAMLESDGIPTRHPRNHAALVPGSGLVIVELRVAEEHYERALRLIEDSSLQGHLPREITFRIERDHSATGAIVGAVLGIVFTLVAMGPSAQHSYLVLCFTQAVFVLGGFGLGRMVRRHRCSKPGCAGRLLLEARSCPKCGGEVRGTVQSTRQHLAALEATLARDERRHTNPPKAAAG